MITTMMMESIPPNTNIFLTDFYNMGTRLGSNVIVMHGNHPSEEAKYLIIVNTETGERIRIIFHGSELE